MGGRTRSSARVGWAAGLCAALTLAVASGAHAQCSGGTCTLTATHDTLINQIQTTNNAGQDLFLAVGTPGDTVLATNHNLDLRTIVRFNMAVISAGTSVSGADLRLYRSQGAALFDVRAHRATASWTEGSRANGGGAGTTRIQGAACSGDTGASWSRRQCNSSGTFWNGGSYAGTATDTITLTASGAYQVWDVTADVSAGNAGNGWFLISDTEGIEFNAALFESAEAGGNAPQLVIDYTCTSGYTAGTTSSCVDENECVGNPCNDAGDGGGSCTDATAPSTGYSCSCGAGYTFNGTTCVNFNDCGGNPCNDSGDSGAVCVDDLPPSVDHSCTCSSGWFDDAGTCEDIDDCVGNPCDDSGDSGAGCTDTGANSYSCSCSAPGWTSSGGTCVDVNECLGDPCGVGGEMTGGSDANGCTNSTGSYSCNCAAGYTYNGSTCVDINECAGNPCNDGSDGGATCTQNGAGGGYTCNCTAGYEQSAATSGLCVDIDACVGAPCGPNGAGGAGDDGLGCVDDAPPGTGNSCLCAQGYTGNGAGAESCVNEDECTTGSNPCNDGDDPAATCTDRTDGTGYDCTCSDPGEFTVTGTTFTAVCVNRDECTDGTANCDARLDADYGDGSRSSCVDNNPGFTCSCNAGFVDADAQPGVVCDDVDECTGPGGRGACDDNGDDGSTCTNQVGTYECTCGPGFELSGDGSTCVDIDECTGPGGRGPCDDDNDTGSTCTNEVGGYVCTCSAGWRLNGTATACDEVDECAEMTDGCDPDGNGGGACTNVDGSYFCTCGAGYSGSGSLSCANLNECSLGTDDCSAQAVCTDTPGDFDCTCWMGFSGDGVACAPVDECADGALNNCDDRDGGARADCTDLTPTANGEPGFSCACNPGWSDDDETGTNPGISCSNIDECGDGTDTCDPNASCTDNDGGYECACDPGYEDTDDAEVGECVEIDECALGTDLCDPNAACANTPPGSYTCTCNAGFTDLNQGRVGECQDDDECIGEGTGHDCDVNGFCTNTVGSFSCACLPGYRNVPGGDARAGDCIDIDECAEGLDDCDADATCADVDGTFSCTCNTGFEGDGTDGNCSNIDECATDTDTCDDNATCADTVGGYTCTCEPGFTDQDNGEVGECVDDDECADEGAGNNCSPNAACTNTPGAFTCACNAGYTGSGVTCLDVNECSNDSHDCREDQVCTNTAGGFDCECPEGQSEGGDGTCQTVCGDNTLAGDEECEYDASAGELEGCVPADDPELTPCTVAPGYRCIRVAGESICVRSCGDGVVDVDEECDLADQNGVGSPVECRDDCTQPRCGDGIVDGDRGEECDDGNLEAGDGCEACVVVEGFECNEVDGVSQCSELCGDGAVDPNEQCDDGDANSDREPDACRSDCGAPSCGDGVVDTGEACDDGEANSDTAAGACRSTCQPAGCGDGVVDSSEECDEGGANAADGSCDTDCTVVEAVPDGGMPDAGDVDADGGSLDGGELPDGAIPPDLPKPDGKGIFGCQSSPGRDAPLALWLSLATLLAWRARRRWH